MAANREPQTPLPSHVNDGSEEIPFKCDVSAIAKYEPYLRVLARMQMRASYQAQVGASDIVQQTMLQAFTAIDQFRGTTEGEWRAWLRQILVRQICHLDRDMHREKRDVRREQSMQAAVNHSSMRLEALLAADAATPSQNVAAIESVTALATAIESLPEGQREAIQLHYLDGLKLSEVAQQMNKTSGAIAGLLHRGMKQLRQNLAANREEKTRFSGGEHA